MSLTIRWKKGPWNGPKTNINRSLCSSPHRYWSDTLKMLTLRRCSSAPAGHLMKMSPWGGTTMPSRLHVVVPICGKSHWAAGVLHNYTGPLPDKLDPHHWDAEALAKFWSSDYYSLFGSMPPILSTPIIHLMWICPSSTFKLAFNVMSFTVPSLWGQYQPLDGVVN
jgi:hypothetical protein